MLLALVPFQSSAWACLSLLKHDPASGLSCDVAEITARSTTRYGGGSSDILPFWICLV